MEKPDVDQIDGLSPAISIDQKGASQNPRSTVGTVTEIYDYLRLLFARIGHPHCPNCGREIERQTVSQIVDQVLALPEGTRLLVLGPLIKDRKTEGDRVFEGARKQGFVRVRVDGVQYDLSEAPTLDKYKRHTIEVVVDRFIVRRAEAPEEWARDALGRPIDPETGAAVPDPDTSRLADSVETALRLGEGVVMIAPVPREGEAAGVRGAPVQRALLVPVRRHHHRRARAALVLVQLPARCLRHVHGPGQPARDGPGPRDPGPLQEHPGRCAGALEQDAHGDLVAHEDHGRRVRLTGLEHEHARHGPAAQRRSSSCSARAEGREGRRPLQARARREQLRRHVRGRHHQPRAPVQGDRVGVHPHRAREVHGPEAVPVVPRRRLRPEVLAVSVDGRNIADVSGLSVTDALDWAAALVDRITEREATIARQVLKEITARLGFLVDVGLDYLTLDRASISLSGGEAQRIRLATQIGTTLMGVLYILDEPSIGLHQRDNAKLIATLTRLRDLGNTVLVVEHDEETIRTADWVIDIGPGAGEHGGEIIANGPLEAVLAEPRSITGAFLRGERFVAVPEKRRRGNAKRLLGPRRTRAQPPGRGRGLPARDTPVTAMNVPAGSPRPRS